MKKPLTYILPLLIGSALWSIPLLHDFHFESAMLAGTIGCFWGGIKSAKHLSESDLFSAIRILGYLYLAGLPLFFFSLFSGCLTIDGVGFWVFVPVPSVFFGVAIGRLTRELKFLFPKTITTFILLFCAVGILLIYFFTFPQVYFYNHVWGLWPGPIYDETVHITGSFFYFRWLTFLWITLLWVIPEWNRDFQTKLITGLALISLIFSYLNLDEAGIISPRETIQQQLGGYHQTEHFDLFFDEEFYSNDDIRYWAARHEFHFQQITDVLKIEWPEGRKVESYLYAHAWQKKSITGAKFTSYVPIWLERDQLHIAKQQLDGVLKHELVHVISKQFGNDLFNGSWSIGLIEGLAEGIAKDASSRSTLHQIVAAEQPWPSAEEMRAGLSFWGFYKSAGAISYTTSGSFVENLLEEFPAENFKAVYSGSSFEQSYQTSFDELISRWHRTLEQTQLDSVDQEVSEFIFAQRSLFQKECPHAINKEQRLWDEHRFHLAAEDTGAAYRKLDELFATDPKNVLIKDAWIRAQLEQRNYSEALNAFAPTDTLITLQVLKADALFLKGGHGKADSLLQTISNDIESSSARTLRFSLEMREDSLQWDFHIERRYLNNFPDSTNFGRLNLPNQMLTLNKALQEKRDSLIILYATALQDHTASSAWFDVYEGVLNRLAYLEKYALAESWIDNINSLNLRLRYNERLSEQIEWINFLKSYNSVAG
ncbi:MAG: hypothetical protein WD357_08160 [Gracilimonas sp.]